MCWSRLSQSGCRQSGHQAAWGTCCWCSEAWQEATWMLDKWNNNGTTNGKVPLQLDLIITYCILHHLTAFFQHSTNQTTIIADILSHRTTWVHLQSLDKYWSMRCWNQTLREVLKHTSLPPSIGIIGYHVFDELHVAPFFPAKVKANLRITDSERGLGL